MFASAVFLLALTYTAVFGAPLDEAGGTGRSCGTHRSTETIVASERLFEAKTATSNVLAGTAITATTISVYFHVIQEDSTLSGGNIPDELIEEQITMLNDAYANASITWALVATTRTFNSDWFNNAILGSSEQTHMKRILRRGGAEVLNVYTVGFTADPKNLGYATFPFEYLNDPSDDGVVIRYDALLSLGRKGGTTLIHEAGHWVGLYHTFQDGCFGSGDFVSDTSPQASKNFGCQVGRDSCPGGGVDPIYNFMGYSDDVCRTEFTPGQITWLWTQLNMYRDL